MNEIPAIIENETSFLNALCSTFDQSAGSSVNGTYQVLETRLSALKLVIQNLERNWDGTNEDLKKVREWFRSETDAYFCKSRMMCRARYWPKGSPGDHLTLEGVYENRPQGYGVGLILDQYFLSRTLAVAVRMRLKKLADILNDLLKTQKGKKQHWLNIACGSCRELLTLPADTEDITVHCVDTDPDALEYAKKLLCTRFRGELDLIVGNAFRFVNPKFNQERFGPLDVIYSAGLFDYLQSRHLVKIINGLYASLTKGGLLILPFKDCNRYETFDYHWLVKWDYFLQRDENEFWDILMKAGVPTADVSVERDDTGVILFYTVRR